MKISNRTDFFKTPLDVEKKVSVSHKQSRENNDAPKVKKVQKPQTSGATAQLVKQASETLSRCGLQNMANMVETILADAVKERFTVAVVGEFSRGKSTFINNLLEHAIELPVGNLPTTAIMTRIRYSRKSQMAVFDEKGVRVALMDINKKSWDGLIANNFGEQQPKGSIIAGVPNKWLGINSIELIDSPGAGDLSEERTQQIIDTLDRTEAAIINISATSPFSSTEKEFIYQRILKRKTPFSMVIVNKLDLVRKEERNGIIKHIKNLLLLNKMDIPVFIPSDVEMTDETYSKIQGLKKIQSIIAGWSNNPKRQALTDIWIKARIQDVVFMAIDSLKEQQKLFDADEKKYKELIQKKKNDLANLELLWGKLELEMQRKSNKCYESFLEKVDEYKGNITERLQFEVAHAASPEQWWKEDYPYRLKVELSNMSVGLDNVISRLIANDAGWFNQKLNQQFKNYVQVDSTSVTDKTDFTDEKSQRKIEFENLSRQQNLARLGTTALCIASYFTPLGVIGSMGIGAGGAVLQSKIFKQKIEEQKKLLKSEIAKDISQIIDRATRNSEKRIQTFYDTVIAQSSQKKKLWFETQSNAIETNHRPKSSEEQLAVSSYVTELESISLKLN